MRARNQMVVRVTTLSSTWALALAMLAPSAFAQDLPPAGTTSSGVTTLIGSRKTASAYLNEKRMFDYHPAAVAPRRSYVASCTSGSTRKIFTSFTSVNASGGTEGMIISANVEANGTVTGFSQKAFANECLDMAGIVANESCTIVAALCKRPSNSPVVAPDLDLVAAIPSDEWGNKFRNALTDQAKDNQMWLYEWRSTANGIANPTGTQPARRFVVAKNILSTETWNPAAGPFVESGHHSLAFAPVLAVPGLGSSDRLYAISMVTKSGEHVGDRFVVVNGSDSSPKIDVHRGWIDSCGTGHTLTNRVAMRVSTNPDEIYPSKFGVLCTTDWNAVANSNKGGIWMRTEGGAVGQPLPAGRLTKSLYANVGENKFNGGGGTLVATASGYLGVIAGAENTDSAVRSRIGLVTYDRFGVQVGSINWLKTSTSHYLGHPQLVKIGQTSTGSARYLLGWAQMMAAPSSYTANQVADVFKLPIGSGLDNTKRVATRYYVQEIDGSGTAKAAEKTVVNGWGEQDQMVSVGNGRAAWVYRPDPTIKLTAAGALVPSTAAVPNPPSPNSTQLIFMTYTSTSM